MRDWLQVRCWVSHGRHGILIRDECGYGKVLRHFGYGPLVLGLLPCPVLLFRRQAVYVPLPGVPPQFYIVVNAEAPTVGLVPVQAVPIGWRYRGCEHHFFRRVAAHGEALKLKVCQLPEFCYCHFSSTSVLFLFPFLVWLTVDGGLLDWLRPYPVCDCLGDAFSVLFSVSL